MEKRHYLMLLSLDAKNAVSGKRLLTNLQQKVDSNSKPIWFDAAHTGIVFTTDMSAADVWGMLFVSEQDVQSFRDVLTVEIGPDWAARRQTTCANWMATHLGMPRPRAIRP
jgi:hypothetical protein